MKVLAGDVQSSLVATGLDIITGNFRQQRNQHVALILDYRRQIGVGHFQPTTFPTEHVQFPGRVKTCLEGVGIEQLNRKGQGIGATPGHGIGTIGIDGRKQICQHCPAQSARGLDASLGGFEGEIRADRSGDQCIQFPVIEVLPPTYELGGAVRCSSVRCLAPRSG